MFESIWKRINKSERENNVTDADKDNQTGAARIMDAVRLRCFNRGGKDN